MTHSPKSNARKNSFPSKINQQSAAKRIAPCQENPPDHRCPTPEDRKKAYALLADQLTRQRICTGRNDPYPRQLPRLPVAIRNVNRVQIV